MTRLHLLGASAAALLLAAPAAAFAQDKDAEPSVSELVATASLDDGGVRRDLIGGSATVISADDLEQRGVVLIGDVLRDVPGIAVSRSGCGGCLQQVRIRGAEANHTLVLVDGMNLANPVGRETDFSTLLGEDGARVEVLRGQQSALYGSEAIGGVVQYFTPDGRTSPGLRVRGEYGSFNTFAGALQQGGGNDNLDYIFSFGAYDSDGTTNTRAGTRDLASDNLTFSTKWHFRLSDKMKLTAVLRANKSSSEFNSATDATGVLLDSAPDAGKGSNTLGKIELLRASPDSPWTHNLSIHSAHMSSHSTSFGSTYDSGGVRQKGAYVATYSFGDDDFKQKITASADYTHESFKQTYDPVRHTLKTRGLIGVYDLVIRDSTAFGASIRNDSNDRFAAFTSYRVQATHSFPSGTRIRAAAGSGIQYPTQFELFGFSGTYLANANLKPEKSEGWEVGLEQSLFDKSVLVGVAYFDNELTDKISTTGFPISTPVNTAGVSNQSGVEVFADIRLDNGISIDASYTNLDSTDGTPPVKTVRRADSIASLNINWASPDDVFRVNVGLRYNGEQKDNRFPFGPPYVVPVVLPAYTLVNLNAQWKINDKVTLYGRADNLFDERYEEVYSYVGPGREVSIGLKARF